MGNSGSRIKFDISHQNGEITYTTPHPLVARLNAAPAR